MKFGSDEKRYEFRKFADDLTDVRDAFAAWGKAEVKPASRETYIVTRLNIESNVKIRDGRLQVKTLQARLGALEEWARPLDAELPVPVDALENIVLPALGLDVEIGERGALGEGALLVLARGQHALATVEVEKQRTLYEIGDCVAEFCVLHVDGEALQTVAIEALSADALRGLLQKVGLEEAQNESYAEFLQRRLF